MMNAWVLLICLAGDATCWAPESYIDLRDCVTVAETLAKRTAPGSTVECRHRDVLLRDKDGLRYYRLVR